jgi:NADPH2:quinone reductase
MTSSKTYAHSKESQNFTVTEVVLPRIAKPNGLLIRQRLLNNPSKGQVMIKVEASGVSFAERAMMRNKKRRVEFLC